MQVVKKLKNLSVIFGVGILEKKGSTLCGSKRKQLKGEFFTCEGGWKWQGWNNNKGTLPKPLQQGPC